MKTNLKRSTWLGSIAHCAAAARPRRGVWLWGGLAFAAGVACCYAIFRNSAEDCSRDDDRDHEDLGVDDHDRVERTLEDEVDEAAFDSFPASDPPAFNAGSDQTGRRAARRRANAARAH